MLELNPVKVEVVRTGKRLRASPPKRFTSLHYGDNHIPFQDSRSEKLLFGFVEMLQPQMILCHGDLLDCYSISRFEKDPSLRVSLQDEVDMAAAHLAAIGALAPKAEKHFILGNHEDRLRRIIWKAAEKHDLRELLGLQSIRNALEWSNLLDLGASQWTCHDGKLVLFDKLIAKHGDVVRKHSSYTARAEYERYSKSGISGHTHRAGEYSVRDWNGQHGWWELGCLCDLNPSYMDDPNWQQGFIVVTWADDRSSYQVERVRIHEGSAWFRGEEYHA